MSCPKDKILNPATGRCVKRDGKIGQQLVKSKPVKKPVKAKKDKQTKQDKTKEPQKKEKCTKDKILNPATGRCVKRDGKIGQQLVKSKPVVKETKKSTVKKTKAFDLDSLKDYYPDDVFAKLKELKITRKLGQGGYGTTYETEDGKAVKIIEFGKSYTRDEFIRETRVQQRMFEAHIAPEIFSRYVFDDFGIISMELLDGTLQDFLMKNNSEKVIRDILSQIETIITKLCDNGLVHGDLKWDNIGYKKRKDGEVDILLIDFGFSCCAYTKIRCNPILELSNLSFVSSRFKNADLIRSLVYGLYQKNGGKMTMKQYGEEYDKLLDEYFKENDIKLF